MPCVANLGAIIPSAARPSTSVATTRHVNPHRTTFLCRTGLMAPEMQPVLEGERGRSCPLVRFSPECCCSGRWRASHLN
jgi:hypothetical protein